MKPRTITCIVCPVGCRVEVTPLEDGSLDIQYNQCARGMAYAIQECTAPTRMITTQVRLQHGTLPVLPVKTASPVPKDRIWDVVAALRDIRASAPIHTGDVILHDAAGTGVDVVASRSVEAMPKLTRRKGS